jgi:hypothetical protein
VKRGPLRPLDADRLERLLARDGISRTGLARLVAVNPSQSTLWLAGRSIPAGDRVEEMCRQLDCSPAYLFGRSDAEVRAYVIGVVRREIGDLAADIIELVTRP